MHAPPANLSFGGQALAGIFGDVAGLAKGFGDSFAVGVGIALAPIGHAAGRVDPHDAVGPDARLAQPAGDVAGLAHLNQKLLPLGVGPHRRATVGRRPNRRRDRSDDQVAFLRLVDQLLDVVVRAVDVEMGSEQEQVIALELDAVDFGRGRQVEHGVEIDGGFGIGPLADNARPGRVVQLGKIVGMAGHGMCPRCLDRLGTGFVRTGNAQNKTGSLGGLRELTAAERPALLCTLGS